MNKHFCNKKTCFSFNHGDVGNYNYIFANKEQNIDIMLQKQSDVADNYLYIWLFTSWWFLHSSHHKDSKYKARNGSNPEDPSPALAIEVGVSDKVTKRKGHAEANIDSPVINSDS